MNYRLCFQTNFSSLTQIIQSKIVSSLVGLVVVLVIVLSYVSLPVLAQSTTNAILLSISRVTKDGKVQDTRRIDTNNWVYEGELNLDDAIRYQWNAVSLDLSCKDKPTRACGYLKIYLNNDSSENNLILDYGSSPLPVDKLAPKLAEGKNTLMFVYIDSTGKPAVPATKVLFTFNFKNTTNKPTIKVVSPAEGALLAKGINRDFVLELTNFQLESTNSNTPNRGKINIYHTEPKASNLIGTLTTSTAGADNKATVKFNSKDLEFYKAPDSLSTVLYFVLTKTSGESLNIGTTLKVKTNYNGSINVGLPRVTIQEPRKDRTDLTVDGNRKFIIQVENFQILDELGKGGMEEGKGYLQIFIDDAPIKTFWPKTDFSLNEIGAGELTEGRKTIKVQLVNKDYTKLVPEAVDSVDIVFVPKLQETNNGSGETQVQSNTWRIIILILTVVLIIGGIAVLITKG
jgi:hypothetical protein